MVAINDLLQLPERSPKPRQEGITHVLDRGLSVADIDGLVEVAGDYVDFVKLGGERPSPPATWRPNWPATATTGSRSCSAAP